MKSFTWIREMAGRLNKQVEDSPNALSLASGLLVIGVLLCMGIIGANLLETRRAQQQPSQTFTVSGKLTTPTAAILVTKKATPEEKPATAQRLPNIDWQDESHIIKAANLLLQHGDIGAALALLGDGTERQSILKQHGETTLKHAASAYEAAYRKQLTGVQAHWLRLTKAQRETLLRGLPVQAQHNIARLGARNVSEISSAECRQLPPPLLLRLIGNIHGALTTAGHPPTVVQFLVEPLLPPRSSVRLLYAAKTDWQQATFDSANNTFAKHIDSELILPGLQAYATEQKERLMAIPKASPLYRWYLDAYGTIFCGKLLTFSTTQPDDATTLELWKRLPAALKPGWRTAAIKKAEQTHGISLAIDKNFSRSLPAIVEPKQDPTALIRRIRQHPDWLASLQRFDYNGAINTLPHVLESLAMPDKLLPIRAKIAGPLKSERDNLRWGGFNWRYLASTLRITGREVNPVATNAANMKTAALWLNVPMQRVHKHMTIMAKTAKEDRRPYYQKMAQLYAQNRGLNETAK